MLLFYITYVPTYVLLKASTRTTLEAGSLKIMLSTQLLYFSSDLLY